MNKDKYPAKCTPDPINKKMINTVTQTGWKVKMDIRKTQNLWIKIPLIDADDVHAAIPSPVYVFPLHETIKYKQHTGQYNY